MTLFEDNRISEGNANENIFSQIKGKESENSYQELERSPKDRHTQTHGNCIEIFRQARLSFLIGRE